jgi:hypothetical protein
MNDVRHKLVTPCASCLGFIWVTVDKVPILENLLK